MENTLENKGKLFSQYFGQKTLKLDHLDSRVKYVLNANLMECEIDYNTSYIIIKSISSITDKDAIEVANYLGWQDHDDETRMTRGKEFVSQQEPDNCYLRDYCFIIDYLRSKGYAIPYMGLSVEKQIEYGWIKLI